jgi:hypothetical protein
MSSKNLKDRVRGPHTRGTSLGGVPRDQKMLKELSLQSFPRKGVPLGFVGRIKTSRT